MRDGLFQSYMIHHQRNGSAIVSETLSPSSDLGGPYLVARPDTVAHGDSSACRCWTVAGILSLFSHWVLEGRKFLVTSKGWTGVEPREINAGDVICLLAGGKVPYALHNVAHAVIGHSKSLRTPVFELIGETYVQGIMDREL